MSKLNPAAVDAEAVPAVVGSMQWIEFGRMRLVFFASLAGYA